MERTEMRTRKGDHGQREFCRLEVSLRDRGDDDGPELSICGTAGYVLKRRDALRQAREYWQSYFEDEPNAITEMNERCGTNFRSPKSAARYVLDSDGEYHGLDVILEDGNDVYVIHSCGQIREEISEFFPEATQFYRFHLNHLNAGCQHQQARGEKPDTMLGAECLECGWKLGHGWHKCALPPEVIEWAKTGKGVAPSEPHYVAGPQFEVFGKRTLAGSLGGAYASEKFRLNGAAPDVEAAADQARRILRDKYDHIYIDGVKAVEQVA